MVSPKKQYIIGVDTGGTFTDTVIVDNDGNIAAGKALTNYASFEAGVVGALENAAGKLKTELRDILGKTIFFGHGTTLGTNSVINRRFAKVGVIATKGHEDVSFIMRAVGRTDGLSEMEIRHQAICQKPVPIAPRHLVKGVTERVDCFGKVVIPLNRAELEQIVKELIAQGVEAIAVCLLWSFANPKHEQEIKAMVSSTYPDIEVVISSEVTPQIREYARTMSVIIEAAIARTMRKYLSSLNSRLNQMGLRYPVSIMQAHGGVNSSAKARAISTIESGPTGGLIGARFLAQILNDGNIIATDVGGTSFDVGILHDRSWSFAREALVSRWRVSIPMVEITSVGAGGGTIARIDPRTKALRIGPDSAGSYPGPVCYDLGGTEPTVTDADVILGYLNPDYFFEGRMKLNKEKALKVMEEKIAKPLGMTAVEAAAGIYDIINSFMADNLRACVIGKGYDPKEFVLYAYGGNGPMHVASYAKDLGVPKALVPLYAPVFSAFGIASSDVIHTHKFSQIHNMPAAPQKIQSTFERMEATAVQDMLDEGEGFRREDVIVERELDMRYGRQIHEVSIGIKGGDLGAEDLNRVIAEWEKKYEILFGKGSAYREAGVQIVSFRVTSRCLTPKPILREHESTVQRDVSRHVKSRRPVFFREYNKYVETNIYGFEELQVGGRIVGPAIIEGPTSTTVILPNQLVTVDKYLNLVFEKL